MRQIESPSYMRQALVWRTDVVKLGMVAQAITISVGLLANPKMSKEVEQIGEANIAATCHPKWPCPYLFIYVRIKFI